MYSQSQVIDVNKEIKQLLDIVSDAISDGIAECSGISLVSVYPRIPCFVHNSSFHS